MNILFEDPHIIVIEKLPGQLSEAGGPDSLITLLSAHFLSLGQRTTAHPIHRLDRNVGGVMVFAKTPSAAAKLSSAVQQGRLTKEYLATVHGAPAPSAGVLTDLLWKDSRKNKTFVVTRPRKGVREAALAYQTLSTREDRSLIHIRLYTGRSHQIRVQFASRKWPLVGDGKYGARDNDPLALYSCRLSFPHPVTGQTITFSRFPTVLGGLSVPDQIQTIQDAQP